MNHTKLNFLGFSLSFAVLLMGVRADKLQDLLKNLNGTMDYLQIQCLEIAKKLPTLTKSSKPGAEDKRA